VPEGPAMGAAATLRWALALIVCATAPVLNGSAAPPALTISDAQALAAGKRLWKNECGGTVSGLTSWNVGENFASLGIGHYIWYPAGERGPFEESFPELLHFLASNHVTLPPWLTASAGCPWKSRADFEHAQSSPELTQLRELLASTVAWQARFSADRLEMSLPKMLAAAPPDAADRVRRQFYRVATSPNGVYALLDYVNFKGEGVLPTERYGGHGWGLLQVLEGMPDSPAQEPGETATREFAKSASRVLAQRVTLSPPNRHESRWLAGWQSRVSTYPP
jgi:hypothetical protein